jgi:hypothetical protein
MASQPVSKEDVYIDSQGNFVKGDDPNVAIQLAHKGVAIPLKLRERHGLDEDGSTKEKRSKWFAQHNMDLMDPAGVQATLRVGRGEEPKKPEDKKSASPASDKKPAK